MVAPAVKQDSNFTNLSFAFETAPGIVDGSVVWHPLEPNSYKDFGSNVKTVARQPINASRQLKKGVVVDQDSFSGFVQDLTADNLEQIGQCFLYANLITKDELPVTDVNGTTNAYAQASGGNYVAGDIIGAKGFTDAANNGHKFVTGTPSTTVPVTDTGLVTAAGQTGIISRVGFRFATAGASIDVSGTYPKLVCASAARIFTAMGLRPGEFIFIGGDPTAERFANANNNGYARIRSISATYLEFDKTQDVMTTDAGTGKTISIFFGRVLVNQNNQALIVKKPVQFERTLGASDTDAPSQIQAQYIVNSLADQMKFDFKTADIARMEFDFKASTEEDRDGVTGLKPGTRPAVTDTDAFNTTSDVAIMKMAKVTPGTSCPEPLFAFLTDLSINVNNNLKANKAIKYLGSFDMTPGFFQVTAEVTAYFTDIASLSAIRDNDSITLETHLMKFNRGISVDLPLVTLNKNMLDVKLNEAVMLPLGSDAATAKSIDASLDYTMMVIFWDYLPDLANPNN